MKRSGKRLLAMLLCLTMALTLLPMSVLAARNDERSETPAEVAGQVAKTTGEVNEKAPGDFDVVVPMAGTITPDGAVEDGWVQDTQTVRGDGSVCAVKDGKLHLKVGSGNENNGDTWTGAGSGSGPAVFVSETMKNALQADADGNYNVSFKVKPLVDGICFGVYFNYKNPANAALAGFNAVGGWFWQNYYPKADGTTEGNVYGDPSSAGPTLAANTTYDVQLSWNPTAKTYTYKMGAEGEALTTIFNAQSYSAVTNATGGETINNIGIKLGKYQALSEVEVWDIHYTGQATVNVYDVSGKVSDSESSELLSDVEVTASAAGGATYTATTNGQGNYTLENMVAGTYALTFTKTGYRQDGTLSVTVSNANMTKNVTMTAVDTVEIQTDGASYDDWTQVSGMTDVDGVTAPAHEDGRLVLTSGYTNSHKIAGNTALFTSAKLNAELAAFTGDTKTLSFTLSPETKHSANGDSLPNYLAFGVVINSDEASEGTFIGYSDTGDKWLYQNYYPNSSSYKVDTSLAAPEAGVPIKFEFTWSSSTLTLKINGKDVDLGSLPSTIGNIAVTNKIAFCVGGSFYENDDHSLQDNRQTVIRISDLHYSGQETVDARYVKGAVTCGGTPVAGATVSVAGDLTDAYTQTTDEAGKYSVALPLKTESYTLSATKDGYDTVEQTVEVTAAADKATLEAVNFALTQLPVISGVVKDTKGKGILGATVKSDLRPESAPAAVTGADGSFTVIGAVDGTHTLTVSAEGYETTTKEVTVAGQNVTGVEITLPDRQIPSYTLSTDAMDVTVAQGFPQAILYTLKDGKTMYGQTAELDTIKINNVAVKPKVTSVLDETTNKKVTYTMVIDSTNNGTTGVTATITAEIRVGLTDVNEKTSGAAGRTLGFYITDVTYPNDDRLDHPVDTIEIPNHSLVSVRSTETGAAVTGARLANNTITSGDATYEAAINVGYAGAVDFFAGFVYNNELSAGLASNSAYAASGTAGSNNNPVRAQFEAKDGGESVSIGLGSTLWYYDHDITQNEEGDKKALTEAQLTKAQRIIEPLDMPYAKVVITGDQNGNGKVDWQDGAIAYRETVMHIPVGGEQVANTANLRISMNFGSMATNPFLIALDNVKRVSAHTDGLGQFVLLKGYAGEGHDSNHPQYDNIGIRMGGPDDLKTLLEEGEKLGAAFGIHTNASEFYAEAITKEEQVLRWSAGGMKYGWNWLDQGISINAVYDYASGLRKARWDKLYEIVQGYPFTVYVDVWGNNTSGAEDDFQTRALSNEILKGHNDWRIAHEWAWANPYESTFQHWTTDYTYGAYTDKGKLNSNVLRFILNEYKDSFPADFATFGGAANAPLLGGPAMQGFEGWQGDGEYNLSIYNTFNQMVATKFLQHYDIMEWSNASEPTLMWWWAGANSSNKTAGRTVENTDANGNKDGTITLQNQNSQGGWDNYGGTTLWTPENQIKLQSADGKQTIVVTRGTDQIPDAYYDYEDGAQSEVEYRSRVITLNGKEILRGAPASAGEDRRFPASKATLQYLIPWYWKVDGTQVDAADEKLYHWNAKGGQSTWELPNGWENLGTVVLYELSDQGRDAGKTVKVIDGKITLSGIKADTGYVVTKGADADNEPNIVYGTGLHLGDPSFNMDTARSDNPWEVSGKGSAIHTTNSDGIGVLKMTGEVSVSQEMTALKPGTKYVSYVAVDNRSNAKASMTITDQDGNMVATNYTVKSIAKNYVSSYYLHNGHGVEAGGSYFQNMFVYFEAEAGKTYTMTLSREAGAGNIYFDDLRTVEYGFNYDGFGAGQTAQNEKGSATFPVEYDPETGAAISLTQDFENVPQGIWPFVVGPVEGVADNRSHVSELNVPFTQAGWDVKKLDDVIDGNWSIKANGLCGRNSLVYQTIPQNFRFEADKVYTVGFDYELGSAGSYIAVVGDGAYTNLDNLTVYNLEQTLNTTVPNNSGVAGNTTAKATVGHIEFTVVGSKSGQTWIGIYSKNDSNNQGTSGSAAAFGGYKDFVLDNLTIELAPAEKNELALLLQEADTMVETSYISAVEGTSDEDAWSAFETVRDEGQAVFDDDHATTEQVTAALEALQTAIANLEKVNISISGTVKNTNNAPVAGVVLTLEDSEYIPVGLEVTTGEDGTFTFVSKSGVELIPATYRIKAQATGYNVMTTDAIVLTKADAEKTKDIVLEAEAPGAYVNDFNNGDIGMMGFLVPNDTPNLPTLEATEFDGTGALKITWNANSGETRHFNNVVDKTMTMANGSFSFDVTPLTNNGIRFGITFRGQEGTADNTNRVFVGQEDGVKKWFVEHWNSEGSPDNGWITVTTKDIGLDCNVTRNVRAVMDGMHFQVYVDGVKIYDVDASTALPSMTTEAGYVGFNMRLQGGSEYIVDNLRIISADAADGVQNVSGTITASGGEAVSGAAVDLYDGENRVAGTSTNALGAYQISRVEPGSYTLKVSAPFFQEQSKTITVAGADLTGQNFTLVLDLTSLTALIDEVEALNEEDYTEETWATLADALAAAEEVAQDSNATVAALNTAYRDLSNAKEALVISEKATADFSELRDLHKEMANKSNENYTNDSWNAFQEALEAARQILLAGTATQEEVDAAKDALQAAFDALEEATPVDEMDFTALQTAYDAAKDIENNGYTEESWAAFEAAREEALAILSNADGRTQAEVDAAAKDLADAQKALQKSNPTVVDTKALKAAITAAENAKNNVVVAENAEEVPSNKKFVTSQDVIDTLNDAIAAAKEALNAANKTEESVAAAVTALNAAVEAFKAACQQGTKKVSTPVVTTETKENEDGSVTTTETKPDGTKVETTEKPDGSTEVVETKPDGTITETTEKPDGSSEVVETKPDGTVTETKTDAEGAKVEKVTDPEENVTIVATDAEGEKLAEVVIPAVIPEPETRFEDVPEGHWADEAIHKLATIEVVNGVGGNQYNMEGDMTRGALATVLHRLSNKPEVGEFTFDDVDNDAYYAEGVAWAEKTGVVKGFSAAEFRPEQTITREQLALMLMRYAKLLGMDITADTAALDDFADGADTHDWAAEGVAWCVQNGILQGKGGSKLDPTANVTRAQVAVMVDRFIALMK